MAAMNAMAITLRLAQRSDAPELAVMSRDLIEAGLGWRYRTETIARLIADRDTTVLVACEGMRQVGFAIMEFGIEHSHLVLLAVRPWRQNQGVGRCLVEWLLESAATAGIASVRVELRADNEAARRFYRKLDFVETLEIPGYYQGRVAALRMLRVLRYTAIDPPAWQPPKLRR
jgi:ribosomal-protein-alanine N-acetyltransferase